MCKDIVVLGEKQISSNDYSILTNGGFKDWYKIIIQDNINQCTIKQILIKLLNSSMDTMRIVFVKQCPLMLALLSYYNGFIDSEKKSKLKVIEQKDIHIYILNNDELVEIK